MPRLKSQREEYFCRQYLIVGTAAGAYRETWKRFPIKPMRHEWSPRSIGSLWTKKRRIAERIEELRTQVAKRNDITEDKVLTDYQWAIESAKLQGKPEAVTNAATAQAKLVGLLRDRIEQGGPGDFDDTTPVEEILAKVAAEKGPLAAKLLADAFGYDYKIESPTDNGTNEAAPDPLLDQAPPTDSVN